MHHSRADLNHPPLAGEARLTAVTEALNLLGRVKWMTRANTEEGSSALPFVFLSFVFQPGSVIAFTWVALGCCLFISVTKAQLSRQTPEWAPASTSAQHHVSVVKASNCRGFTLSSDCWHIPKPSDFTGEWGLTFSFGKCWWLHGEKTRIKWQSVFWASGGWTNCSLGHEEMVSVKQDHLGSVCKH